jgi:predicted dehydrogenase
MQRGIKFHSWVVLLAGLLLVSCTGKKSGTGISLIRTEVPERSAGQTHVLGLTAPKLDTVRVGFIGLGMRGPGAVERFTHIPGVKIVALCDKHADRVERSQKILEKAGFPLAASYSGSADAWKELCQRDDIDLVYIVTDWQHHAEMMLYAMEQGKHVACEVPAAMTLEEIWKVVDTAERTRKHCMMLENCVYDFFELTTLNMARHGLFGEILHVEGGYLHNLEDFWDYYEGDWRMRYNKAHRGDVYPTHGFGPACQLLDIHRGDRLDYLVSMDTKPVNIPEYLIEKRGMEADSAYDFRNGEHTMTMVRTEKEKTVLIRHDVSSPRPYSRCYEVTGTKGFAQKYPQGGYAFRSDSPLDAAAVPDHENLSGHGFVSEETMRALMDTYKHPIHKELEELAKQVGGHGGMDFIMDYRLIYCLRNGLPLDMDVYDLAEWCCLVPLSEISLDNGSAPVAIPDFTRGHWNDVQGYRHAFVE